MDLEPVIGLEVHVQLNTRTKIFCGCRTNFGQEPNTAVCPICLGYPGVLPVLNREVVRKAVATCHLLQFEINHFNKMDRKNYFYPDLPKGYQISQYDVPIGVNGRLQITVGEEVRDLAITRVHMEEDAGKLIHDGDRSLVDFNRTGVPLLEIVSEPVIRSSEEAVLYLKKLKQTLLYGGISDCNMEEGSLRCDANISVRPRGSDGLGTKTEIKNLNSFKFVQKALDYEIERHIQVIREGGRVTQETRLFDADRGKTRTMRSKEEAHDYRYFPEPDLVPLNLDPVWVEKLRDALPESPDAKLTRYQEQFELPLYDAEVLTADLQLARYFETCIAHCRNTKLVSNWMMSEMIRHWSENNQGPSTSAVAAEELASLLNCIDSGRINGKIAKDVLPEMFTSGQSAMAIIEARGLSVISDQGELQQIIDEVIAKNGQTVEDYRSGKKKAAGFLVGQVMKMTRGKADPATVNQLIAKALS